MPKVQKTIEMEKTMAEAAIAAAKADGDRSLASWVRDAIERKLALTSKRGKGRS